MSLDAASIPLAGAAGVLSILSPCVWPLVPVVMSSAATGGRSGPWFLALGLSTAFALAGTLLTLVLLNLHLDPEALRYVAAILLLLIAATLLVRPVADWVSLQLSRLTGRFDGLGQAATTTPVGQFGVGALLGLVWLPCVGPTLGAAIALASLGQQTGMAFVIMFAFGIGTASALLAAGLLSNRLLARWRPATLSRAGSAKKLLGWTLLLLGVLVLTGWDKVLETMALGILPDWAISI
jgi:cytochrome c-type biogenesis protein